MWSEITSGDFGWVGKLRMVQDGTAVDISAYTTRQFIFKSPIGAVTTKTATFDDDGTDGILKYTVADGDIDRAGSWRVQARIAKTGVELTSDPLHFQVEDRLDE